jgi:nucleoside-diphosphate-sugar epimerase
MKTVLITGAAGNIGSQLRQQFAAKYRLRLSDKRLLRPRADDIGKVAKSKMPRSISP